MYVTLYWSALLSLALAAPSKIEVKQWSNYKSVFGKSYPLEQDTFRYNVWKQNVQEIENHNMEKPGGYRQGLNRFTDMTDEEMELMLQTANSQIDEGNNDDHLEQTVVDEDSIPAEVNWVTKGYVTSVKNGMLCPCAYSAVGALEGQWFKKTGKLNSLSVNQIADCSEQFGIHGCWSYINAWKYIMKAGGIESSATYPFKRNPGHCYFNKTQVVAKCTGYTKIKKNDEEALKVAVATVGPISALIDVERSFMAYRSGIHFNPHCSSKRVNHAVLIVGYGSQGGNDYWLVKNSWGTAWGMHGYIKMARNRNNNCGIASYAAYPTV